MPLKTITCYLLHCDGCDEKWRGFEDFIPHYDHLNDAVSAVRDADDRDSDSWCVVEDGSTATFWCGTCRWLEGHGHVLDPQEQSPGACLRCGLPADQHDAVTEESTNV